MHPDTEARMAGIARAVLEKTQDGGLTWVQTDEPSKFLASTSTASLTISAAYDDDGDEYIEFCILNSAGDELESIGTYTGRRFEKSFYSETLIDLQEYARRSALSLDTVLDDLLEEFGAGPIWPEKRAPAASPPSPPAYNPDEEPF